LAGNAGKRDLGHRRLFPRLPQTSGGEGEVCAGLGRAGSVSMVPSGHPVVHPSASHRPGRVAQPLSNAGLPSPALRPGKTGIFLAVDNTRHLYKQLY